MSRFMSSRHEKLVAYTPGEQPKERKYIKLNTNESPFPPSPRAVAYAFAAAKGTELYSDPECRDLKSAAAKSFGVSKDEMIFANGSDEALYFAFMVFCDGAHGAVFPDITYGFYPVFAQLCGVPYTELPLRADFSVDINDYIGRADVVFLANPNALTGVSLPLSEIERLIASNRNRLVIVDEAYVDFGGESALPLIGKYDNLLVIQTFSKSRSLAGARLGAAFGAPALIADLNTVRCSVNPYNVNSVTAAAGIGALEDGEYTKRNCAEIMRTRAWTEGELTRLGFEMTPSRANFIFAKHNTLSGQEIYEKLREKGILVRHFTKPRICEYNRITVGSKVQMQALCGAIEAILEEK